MNVYFAKYFWEGSLHWNGMMFESFWSFGHFLVNNDVLPNNGLIVFVCYDDREMTEVQSVRSFLNR